MMELVLVRHGEPEWIRDGLNVDNPPLTERGHEQSRRLAERLVEEDFDELLVSPLVRARQTVAPLAELLGRPPQVEDWSQEIANPIWHGTPAEKAEAAFAEMRGWPSSRRWDGLPGGEAPRDFVARIHQAATDFLAARGVRRVPGPLPVWEIDKPEQRWCLVAHGGTNAVLICHLLGLEPTPWEWDRFVLQHASVSRVESLQLGDGWTFGLTRLSDVDHLSPELRTR